jgi:high affinity Mn2+ porin
MRKQYLLIILLLSFTFCIAQTDSTKAQRFNFHFQQTIITQTKPAFSALYSGDNSLSNQKETATSLTGTLFMGAKLWKGAALYFNPEIAGGEGFSSTLGLAGFTNGETFRIGSSKPAVYIARAYITQRFEWGNQSNYVEDDKNVLAGYQKDKYFSITAGKFGLADFFDNNAYSHDPRTQFMNWSLMSNGAWDYPANTRGYVFGVMMELGQPNWKLRLATTMLTTDANGSIWDEKIGKANSFTLEYERSYKVANMPGTFRVLGFNNTAKMGSYDLAIAQNPIAPDIIKTRSYGRNKFGLGLNIDQAINNKLGIFAKGSFNDGKTETWAFTEIDHTISVGAVLDANIANSKNSHLGLAFVGNGISKQHRSYLAAGGYGFIIGDGKLNYAPELITELFYKVNVYQQKFWLTPDYQFILNPAYNIDRGPVNVFSLRAHVTF